MSYSGKHFNGSKEIPILQKKSKYRAQKSVVDGIKFDSKKEAARYRELRLLERAGEIGNLRLQVPYVLLPKSRYGREIKYIADFVYFENNEIIIEDVKGVRTAVYKLKKRMMAEKYGIVIRET